MRWTILGVSLCVLACEQSVESQDIRTSGIYPEISVTANGSGNSEVRVRLKVGGSNSNTFLDLTGGDELQATVGDMTKTLDETSDETYTASFPVEAEGTQFVIGFLRTEADESAPASTVTLPAPFALSLGATESSRATDDVAITWDPPGSGNADWSLEGDCIIRDDGSVPDDGSHTLPAASIETFESDQAETCTANLSLTRSQSGNIDAAFTEGGRIVASQVRRTSFSSTP
jgi:hypothetical protein